MTTSSSSFVRLTSSSSSTLTSSTLTTSTTTSTPAVPVQTGAASQEYQVYSGDGTVAQGWPSEDQWVDFEYMFEINAPDMRESCAAWGVPNNSDEETATIKDAIQSLSAQSGVDARLILAVIMQESTGCVRVITTAYSVLNPGLMQSHAGAGTCNTNNAPFGIPGVSNTGTVQDPCPASEIYQMVRDGTAGTDSGDGLQQLLVDDDRTDVSRFYRAARMYNGGRLSIGTDGNLETGCCTTCYVSDIANRLTGWTNAPRVCDL
ncbi:hypothetical protein K431DRAFT_227712 [Polychaeton citri CBS 116435]|uniref:Uncharacterized protein n=1 Tax=Polychaeton citri CBS 116435 TaxID=1314669 RepID=A0A9P4UPD3_9PEZI|nr:hypothetical protein K431DRAFT_227712 [Polychaeton citri CBS 116435]